MTGPHRAAGPADDPAAPAPDAPALAAPALDAPNASAPQGSVVDPPLPLVLAIASVVVFTAVAVLAAAIEVVLVPVRIATVVVPVSVVLAVVGNVAIPTLSRRAVPRTVAALLPALGWLATVISLSQARPEGDVLLIGSSPLVYVTYALLGFGIVAAMVTVVRGQARGEGRWAGQSTDVGVMPTAASARSTRR